MRPPPPPARTATMATRSASCLSAPSTIRAKSASATYVLTDRTEVFPEPRACRRDLLDGTNLVGHTFNQFFPWAINQDGTSGETLNHIGRARAVRLYPGQHH